jgi:hypothetical protein
MIAIIQHNPGKVMGNLALRPGTIGVHEQCRYRAAAGGIAQLDVRAQPTNDSNLVSVPLLLLISVLLVCWLPLTAVFVRWRD